MAITVTEQTEINEQKNVNNCSVAIAENKIISVKLSLKYPGLFIYYLG